ncbi:hypothetical protein [Streptomyces sp. NPDC004726]
MRPRTVLVVGVTAATALAGPAVVSATAVTTALPVSGVHVSAVAEAAPASVSAASHARALARAHASALDPMAATVARRATGCSTAVGKDFPIDTRIHGGPSVHHPGGGFEEWSVDLTNTTDRTCDEIHPVIVFAGGDPGLTPQRMTLEFYDDRASLWRAAQLESTTEDEVVGVLGIRGEAGTGEEAGAGTAGEEAGTEGAAGDQSRDGDQSRGDQGRDGDQGGAGTRDAAVRRGEQGGGFSVKGRSTVTVKVRLALAADTPPNQVTVNAAVVQRHGDDGDWVGESDEYRFAVLKNYGTGVPVTHDALATTGPGPLLRLGTALGTILLGSGALVLVSRRLRSRRR